MKQKIAVSAMTLGAVLLLSGCGLTDWAGKKAGEKIMEKSIESQTGGSVDINSDKGQMNIKSNEGDFSMSGEGTATLSADFPKDIFIATDAKIQLSMANGKDKSYSVAYITSMSVDEIYGKYKSDLESKGWAADTKTEMTIGTSKITNYKKGTQNIAIIIGVSEDEKWQGKTSVQVTGSEDSASGSSSDSVGGGMNDKSL
ncbi:MAG: hypothetical protein WCV59_02120 [Parcubacteria group bacterium]|jgi:hypothetical protein